MTMVGRESESAAVLGLTSGVLILTGEPGAGKSTLLGLAADRHRGRVLRMTGSESEANLTFAGLHQLLRPVLGETAGLSARQRSALLGAIGLGDAEPHDTGLAEAGPHGTGFGDAGPHDTGLGDAEPHDTGLRQTESGGVESGHGGPPDRLLLGVALLNLLSDLARRSPVLVVADDVQWIDAGSLELLAFAARRIGDEPLAVLAAARDTAGEGTRGGATAPFSGFPLRTLGPLDATAAGLLLDRQPHPPTGRGRLRILDQAAGNPLALVELARANGACGAGSADSAEAELLPPTDRLMRVFAADLEALPEAT
ncbi:AAA family ATPase, partial [Streptomyces sp. NPDC059426]